MKQIIIILQISALILAGCKSTSEYEIVISNIDLFDGQQDLGKVDIAINQDTIAAVSAKPLRGMTMLDGNNLYAMPGMVNAHAHSWLPEQLKEAFEVGVLASFDLYQAWPMSQRSPIDLRILKDSLGYANFHSAGPAATVREGHASHESFGYEHPPDYPFISDSLSAEAFIQRAIAQDAEMIKIIREPGRSESTPLPTLSYKQIEDIIRYAEKKDLKTVVHITHLEDALQIARYKPSGFAHLWFDRAKVTDDDLMTLKKSGVFVIPTLMLQENSNLWLDTTNSIGKEEIVKEKEARMYPDSLFQNQLKRLFDAGIPLIAGNDAPNNSVNFGSDFIEELKIYASSGIPTIEVLKTATGTAAQFLPTAGIGRITEGGPATFLILNEDPTTHLDALESIVEIWKNGERAITKAKKQ